MCSSPIKSFEMVVLKIMNETTAAALSYSLYKDDNFKIMVYVYTKISLRVSKLHLFVLGKEIHTHIKMQLLRNGAAYSPPRDL